MNIESSKIKKSTDIQQPNRQIMQSPSDVKFSDELKDLKNANQPKEQQKNDVSSVKKTETPEVKNEPVNQNIIQNNSIIKETNLKQEKKDEPAAKETKDILPKGTESKAVSEIPAEPKKELVIKTSAEQVSELTAKLSSELPTEQNPELTVLQKQESEIEPVSTPIPELIDTPKKEFIIKPNIEKTIEPIPKLTEQLNSELPTGQNQELTALQSQESENEPEPVPVQTPIPELIDTPKKEFIIKPNAEKTIEPIPKLTEQLNSELPTEQNKELTTILNSVSEGEQTPELSDKQNQKLKVEPTTELINKPKPELNLKFERESEQVNKPKPEITIKPEIDKTIDSKLKSVTKSDFESDINTPVIKEKSSVKEGTIERKQTAPKDNILETPLKEPVKNNPFRKKEDSENIINLKNNPTLAEKDNKEVPIDNAIKDLKTVLKELNRPEDKILKEAKGSKKNDDNKDKGDELINNDFSIDNKDKLPQMMPNMNFGGDGQPFSSFMNENSNSEKNSDNKLNSTQEELAEEAAILSTMAENIAIANKAVIKQPEKSEQKDIIKEEVKVRVNIVKPENISVQKTKIENKKPIEDDSEKNTQAKESSIVETVPITPTININEQVSNKEDKAEEVIIAKPETRITPEPITNKSDKTKDLKIIKPEEKNSDKAVKSEKREEKQAENILESTVVDEITDDEQQTPVNSSQLKPSVKKDSKTDAKQISAPEKSAQTEQTPIAEQPKEKIIVQTDGIKKVDTKTNIVQEVIVKYDTVIMNEADVEVFKNLVEQGEVNLNNPAPEAAQKSVHVSKTLADMLAKSMEDNKPVRIEFDNNISVIIKISRDGKISADFLPSSQAAEAYLKENIPLLKQRFDEQNIDYDQLNRRERRNQDREQGRKKGNNNE